MPPKHIAVLGGGITGLASAFHLSRRFPTSLVTLLEKENRFGGWVKSDRVEVEDKGGNRASLLLEAGPRTLRPGAKGVMELVRMPSKSYLINNI
jgi:protoporphyrinogen/coproporphyrinogen III oxidase